MDLEKIIANGIEVTVSNGQIVSMRKSGFEYMHGGGKPDESKTDGDRKGWQNSEIVMFPVIGALQRYALLVDHQVCLMDQHGVARNIPFVVKEKEAHKITLLQSHDGITPIENQKYAQSTDNPQQLAWPFAYTLEKSVSILTRHDVTVTFTLTNASERAMPYEFGWHPAFRCMGPAEKGVFEYHGTKKPLTKRTQEDEGLLPSGGMSLLSTDKVTYSNQDTLRGVTLTSEGFTDITLWCPAAESGMFCIEPVTRHEHRLQDENYFHDGHQLLLPKQSATYRANIRLHY
ncbi:hypothetical protein C4573_04485 [Candidatus Woesearchaeota archaeon]|nr:MAG: hypothetical protein C4573_04485 [Candidatus Woesearchaeota archaeon]